MLNLKSKKKGGAYIEMLVGLFVILFVTMLVINEAIPPLTVYFQLRQAGRSALLQMETQGGITQDVRDNIKNSINFYDYDSSYLTISPETNVTDSTLPAYGSTIPIDLEYKYHYTTYTLNGFNIVPVSNEWDIGTRISTTSKKAQK